MNRKINFNILWLGIISFVLIVSLGTFFIIKFNKAEKESEDIPHIYIQTTVVEKSVNPGYGGWYIYKDTEYIIVSETENGDRIITYAGEDVYYNYNIGDTILYCESHGKLKLYE